MFFISYKVYTLDYKLIYRKSERGLYLNGYSDRRSTTGYYFSMNPKGPAISWKSKKQATIALSSCEAEYMALAATVQEAVFLSMLINSITESCEPIIIYADNQGAML